VAEYPCQECSRLRKARDFQEIAWRHLNMFLYHCYVIGRRPRVACPERVSERIAAPRVGRWAVDPVVCTGGQGPGGGNAPSGHGPPLWRRHRFHQATPWALLKAGQAAAG